MMNAKASEACAKGSQVKSSKSVRQNKQDNIHLLTEWNCKYTFNAMQIYYTTNLLGIEYGTD